MTDLEISKALALAIGWKPEQLRMVGNTLCASVGPYGFLCSFDYRDPAVIWPIAERFDCFPVKSILNWYANGSLVGAPTAARAVALAVIGAKS